ncbi:MAG: histone family protein [Candidatus Aenigmarchaeota archaeon]|nr:histone family protein [Candidatus Aenigmarchaeota archaeon]MCK4531793.1 histone family protein [Candidatus Aenigmarchaeota archaeon]
MPVKKHRLPLAPFERILKDAGAKRVSKTAMKEFATMTEEIADDLARDAVKFAKHAGRKTVTGEDIRLAKRK